MGKKPLKSSQERRVILARLVDSRVNNVLILNSVFGAHILKLDAIGDLTELGTYPLIDDLDFFWIDAQAMDDIISRKLRNRNDPVCEPNGCRHHETVIQSSNSRTYVFFPPHPDDVMDRDHCRDRKSVA